LGNRQIEEGQVKSASTVVQRLRKRRRRNEGER
jgi:hypothetical protein